MTDGNGKGPDGGPDILKWKVHAAKCHSGPEGSKTSDKHDASYLLPLRFYTFFFREPSAFLHGVIVPEGLKISINHQSV